MSPARRRAAEPDAAPLAAPLAAPMRTRDLERTRALAALLDAAVRIPGTNIRFGLDPLLGLIPGIGDLVGGGLSAYVMLLAARAGAPKAVLLRMLANVGIDALVGTVPLAGDLFDVAFKANVRNLALFHRFMEAPGETRRASMGFIVLLLAAAVAIAVGAVWIAVMVLRWLAGALV